MPKAAIAVGGLVVGNDNWRSRDYRARTLDRDDVVGASSCREAGRHEADERKNMFSLFSGERGR